MVILLCNSFLLLQNFFEWVVFCNIFCWIEHYFLSKKVKLLETELEGTMGIKGFYKISTGDGNENAER